MEKFFCVVILLLVNSFTLHSEMKRGQTTKAKSNTIVIRDFPGENPGEKTICFLPDTQKTVPCIIFCHAFGEQYQSYQELISHCIDKGSALVYSPARRVSFTRNKIVNYDFGISSISDAISSIKTIDTSRVMIIGHGFGAGAVPALMKGLREKGWGSRAAVMYLMSPWYLYSITERELNTFPDSVSLIVEVFQHDNFNDPMIAADIFSQIGIPANHKAFITIKSDYSGLRKSTADYSLPFGNQSLTGTFDYLDTISILNVVDTLFKFGFAAESHSDSSLLKNNTTFRLHSGNFLDSSSNPQVIITDSPFVNISNKPYLNPWKSVRNPRVEVSQFRKFRKLTMRYRMNKVNQVSRYLARKVTSKITDNGSDSISNPIDSGFGADGPLKTKEIVFKNPAYPEQNVYVFLPESVNVRVPLLLFLHGYNGGDPTYFSHLIPHIVSNGTAVIFPTYSSFPMVKEPEVVMEKYAMIYSGISEAFRMYGSYFDSTRVGIFGHSFGGGAVLWVALKAFTERGWGTNGAFLFVSAPWYIHGINDSGFYKLPSHLKAVIITYQDDDYNDHQMAVDMFGHLNIPSSGKRFFVFKSDTLDSIIQPANHFVPYGIANINGVQDNLDYFGIFKLFDALTSYSFYNNTDGQACALGNSSELQTWMGLWPDGTPVKQIESTTKPKARREQNKYVFAWDNPLNVRYKGALPSRGK